MHVRERAQVQVLPFVLRLSPERKRRFVQGSDLSFVEEMGFFFFSGLAEVCLAAAAAGRMECPCEMVG